MAKHVVVTDDDSGYQALYVTGDRVDQGDTIYAGDIAGVINGYELIQFSHVIVEMPKGADSFPEKFEQCMLWSPSSPVS